MLYWHLYNYYIVDISVSLFFIPTHQNNLLPPSVFGLLCCCWPYFFALVFPLLLLAAASLVLGSIFGRFWHVSWGCVFVSCLGFWPWLGRFFVSPWLWYLWG